MTGRIETTILRGILFDEEYTRKILPFIDENYFQEKSEKALFKAVKDFVQQYNNQPTPEAIAIILSDAKGMDESDFKLAMSTLDECIADKDERPNQEWLLENTENFCKDRAIVNAVMEAVQIVTGEHPDKQKDRGSIPELLTRALAVCLDPHIGHDYFEDAEKRYEYYHRSEQKIPFDLEWFNKVTNGGIPAKTLNIVLAGTHVGKTLIMCHFAANYLKAGKNVLYITLEVAEEEIIKRIDANLLNIAMDDLTDDYKVPKSTFQQKIDSIKSSTTGRLVAKEYPTAAAHSGHFRHLLNELRLKKNFVPDVVFIDYLNICASSRMKQGPNVNSYTYVKAISEELRGLGVEFIVPIWTATQTNRSGFGSSDVGMEDTSESFGLPMTADFMFAAMTNDELQALNQYLIKVLKCRYTHSQHKRFVVGVDYAKMRIYDVEQSAQDDLIDPQTGAITKGGDGSPGPGGSDIYGGHVADTPLKVATKEHPSQWGSQLKNKDKNKFGGLKV